MSNLDSVVFYIKYIFKTFMNLESEQIHCHTMERNYDVTFLSRFVRSHLNHNQQKYSWHTFMFYNALGTSDHPMKAVWRHSQKCFLTNYFIFYVMVHKWLCFQLNKNQTKAPKQFHLRYVLKVLDVSYLWHLGLQLVLC